MSGVLKGEENPHPCDLPLTEIVEREDE